MKHPVLALLHINAPLNRNILERKSNDSDRQYLNKSKKIRLLVAADLQVSSFQDAAAVEEFGSELEGLIKEFFNVSHTSSNVTERRGDKPVDLSRMSFRLNKNKEVRV